MTYHYTPPGGHTQYHAVPSPAGSPYGQHQQQQQPQQHQQQPQQQHQQQQTPYAVDPAVASQWSSQSNLGIPALPPQQQYHQQPSISQSSQGVPPPVHGLTRDRYLPTPFLQQQATTNAPKPEHVKRATSHQNETAENRHGFDGQSSVKRAFVSRDGSIASSQLKEDYLQPEEYGADPVAAAPPARPSALTLEERMSTLDLDAAALSPSSANNDSTTANQRPRTLTASNRLSTIDALTLDFDNPDRGLEDLFDQPSAENQQYRYHQPARPSTLRSEFRVTTMDLIDIVNEPLPFAEV
jgi:hypothetical protein